MSKLYRVTLQGGNQYQVSYAVATNPEQAYRKVKTFLDKEELCFSKNRNLQSVELIADADHYGEIETMLYL